MSRRQPNFTREEVEVLLGCVEGKRAVLFGTFGAGLSSVVKDSSWEEGLRQFRESVESKDRWRR